MISAGAALRDRDHRPLLLSQPRRVCGGAAERGARLLLDADRVAIEPAPRAVAETAMASWAGVPALTRLVTDRSVDLWASCGQPLDCQSRARQVLDPVAGKSHRVRRSGGKRCLRRVTTTRQQRDVSPHFWRF